jgi:hypothetical protein
MSDQEMIMADHHTPVVVAVAVGMVNEAEGIEVVIIEIIEEEDMVIEAMIIEVVITEVVITEVVIIEVAITEAVIIEVAFKVGEEAAIQVLIIFHLKFATILNKLIF